MTEAKSDMGMPEKEEENRVVFRMVDGIATLTIDNPPVNAGSLAVRQGLLSGLARAEKEHAQGVVIVGAGRCFVAGSDLREFGKPLEKPELPDVIKAIEDSPLPVVAALHGVALGGGLELALGCDYRIASPATKLGLPEVTLGMVPGAGGTQRLPRLIGQVAAVSMVCDGRRIPAADARSLGLVDALAEDDLLAAAIQFLKSEDRPKRLATEQPLPEESPEDFETAANRALKRGKKRPNVAEAVRLVKAAADPDVAATLTDERAVFQRLRLGSDAFALRYLFFAERQAASVDGLDIKAARPLKHAGVVGGGTMGQGIIRALLSAGLTVTVIERDSDALDRAMTALRQSLQNQVDRGRLASSDCAQRLKKLAGATSVDALADCDLVIEAVFEDMVVKAALLRDLEAAMRTDAIIATNTSYLDINTMVTGLSHPERVLGLHFFSPADIMPLLEVVRADKTSDEALATSLALARQLGKQPVVARVAEGFIGNRIYAAYRRRAELLVLDGAAPEDVDRAITSFGFAMGVFAVSDMSGLDIAWAMRKRQAATRDPKARYVAIPDKLCEAGRLGRKTNGGWYDYTDGKATPSPVVAQVIDDCRSEAGIVPTPADTGTIQRQLLAAIVNEAALLLDEGVAQRPSDVDVTLTNGYGFPRWLGGPLYWAAQQDRAALRADLDALAKAVGHGHREGPAMTVLDQLDLPVKD